MRRLIVLGTTICLFLLGASAARAEVVTIDGTIKSVDAKKRTITIDTGSKTLTLDVSSKAKISVDGTEAGLGSLKAGQKVNLSYHDKLEIVLKIIADVASPESIPRSENVVRLVLKAGKLDIQIGDQPFTSYNFAKTQQRPYFWPLRAPGGQIVSRPLVKPTDRPKPDHPHHRGLWFAVDKVNGIDFWGEGGKIRNVTIQPVASKGNPASFKVVNHWLGLDGEPVVVESSTISVFPDHVITYDTRLAAGKRPVTFGDTKEGMFGLRMVDSIGEKHGGRIENADGLRGEKACWGQPSEWVDCSGIVGKKTLGVAIFDNPQNFRRSRFQVRGYGLLAINPFGQNEYTGGSNPQVIELKTGENLRLRYGIYIHEGTTKEADVPGTFRKYVAAAGD